MVDQTNPNINFATANTQGINEIIDDMFEYHKWDDLQVEAGKRVRTALANAVKTIIAEVPPSPDRTTAIRKLREARMDCNSALTHRGRY